MSSLAPDFSLSTVHRRARVSPRLQAYKPASLLAFLCVLNVRVVNLPFVGVDYPARLFWSQGEFVRPHAGAVASLFDHPNPTTGAAACPALYH
jgi:hypothetical protein